MNVCPACRAKVRFERGSCPRCGEVFATSSELTTAERRPLLRTTQNATSLGSRSRFVAGELLVHRYRIVDHVGKGAMGEVYRADDLTLEQQVALKFLPGEVSQDAERIRRFRGEVRIARQIHPPQRMSRV